MTEKREYQGYFYVPGVPEKKISGILYFYPNEKIQLELIGGCLSGKPNIPFCEHNYLNAIFGVVRTENGVSNVTLLDCYGSGNMSYNRHQNCEICFAKYSCGYLLVGKHLADKDDKAFNRICVSFPYFKDWYKDNNIQYDCENDFTAVFKTINDHKNPLKIQLNDIETLILNGCSKHCTINNDEKRLYNESYVELESTNKSKFFDLLVRIGWFKDFYSFTSMSAMPFSYIYLYDYDDFHEVENGSTKIKSMREKEYTTVSLFYVAKERMEEKDRFFYTHFLFDFQKIQNKFEMITRAWYEKRENSEPIIQLLIASVTNNSFFRSSDFLIVVQAIEGYYNRFEKEYGLRNILTALYLKYGDVQIINKNKPDLDKVVDSRHYYSHILPVGKKKDVCKDWELHALTEKLKPLLICCVLTLIGFENQKIDELLSHHYTWNSRGFLVIDY